MKFEYTDTIKPLGGLMKKEKLDLNRIQKLILLAHAISDLQQISNQMQEFAKQTQRLIDNDYGNKSLYNYINFIECNEVYKVNGTPLFSKCFRLLNQSAKILESVF